METINIIIAEQNTFTITPVNIRKSVVKNDRFDVKKPNRGTIVMLPVKADNDIQENCCKANNIPKISPIAVPQDTHRIDGSYSGFLNKVWKTIHTKDREAPTKPDIITQWDLMF